MDIKKINRNNRKRGGQLEKNAGDFLDMDIVPYSGSNARFGYGDIRDSIWLGECKNITPKDNVVVIKREWLDKNRARAHNMNKKPFLVWMARGMASKYVILESDDYIDIAHKLEPIHAALLSTGVVYLAPRNSYNVKNLHIDIKSPMANVARKRVIAMQLDGINVDTWFMMSIGVFRDLLYGSKLKGIRSGDQNV